MAIPSGSGTEVLKRATGVAHDAAVDALTCATLHIYTIISIIVCNDNTSDCAFYMQIHDGSTDRRVVRQPVLPANSTFIWNDKIVLHPGDVLKIEEYGNVSNLPYWISYIDQDWTTP